MRPPYLLSNESQKYMQCIIFKLIKRTINITEETVKWIHIANEINEKYADLFDVEILREYINQYPQYVKVIKYYCQFIGT